MSTSKPTRSDYPYLHAITTRWHDNDIYGHVNNVTYYSYFDSAVNAASSVPPLITVRSACTRICPGASIDASSSSVSTVA